MCLRDRTEIREIYKLRCCSTNSIRWDSWQMWSIRPATIVHANESYQWQLYGIWHFEINRFMRAFKLTLCVNIALRSLVGHIQILIEWLSAWICLCIAVWWFALQYVKCSVLSIFRPTFCPIDALYKQQINIIPCIKFGAVLSES